MSASRVVVATLVALVALLTAASAGAKTYEVNKRSDHAPNGCKKKDCTLREAVLAANARGGSDRIVLPKNKTYNLSIENSVPPGEDEAAEGDLDITDPLRISHPGKGKSKIDAHAIDRVFHLLEGGPTTFKRVVVTGGEAPSGGGGGGGILTEDADLTLLRSGVNGNRNESGGNYGGAAELNGDSDLRMVRSTMNGNFSDSDSGAIEGDNDVAFLIKRSKLNGNISEGTGGALYLDGADGRILQTTIAGNRADNAGGINGNGELSIDRSTIANNIAASGDGGGIDTSDDLTTITNSTIAANRADGDGGGIEVDGPLTMNAGSVVRNAAGDSGGGLSADTTDDIEVENSLIALNQATAGDDCAGDPFASLGHNLLGTDQDCDGFDATGDFVNSNPKLGKLKNNGGPTQTVALKKGSPAINKAAKSAPNKDQRGEKRGKKPDIGAYERVKSKKKKGRR
jgi:hypothetical protein